jgi:hypothetical protein
VVWHPCPRQKAHKKGLNIVSKKSDNSYIVFQIPFQKFLKKQEGHSQVYNLFYLMGHFSCVMVLPELFLRESGNTPVSIDKFINDVNWLKNILHDMFISTTNIKNCKISAVLNKFLI